MAARAVGLGLRASGCLSGGGAQGKAPSSVPARPPLGSPPWPGSFLLQTLIPCGGILGKLLSVGLGKGLSSRAQSTRPGIRHNLSLNKRFQKVSQQMGEPGKGGFWQIHPQYAGAVVNNIFQQGHLPAAPLPPGRSLQILPACDMEPASPARIGSRLPAGTGGHLCKDDPCLSSCTSQGSQATVVQLLAPGSREEAALPGELGRPPVLEDPFDGASSSFEDLELGAALRPLAAGEEALVPPYSPPAPSPFDQTRAPLLCSTSWGRSNSVP